MMEENQKKLDQVAVRLVKAPPLFSDEVIRSPTDAVRILAKELSTYDREVVCVVNLKKDLKPINFTIASMGSIDESIISPRELMKAAILSNAASIMLIHLHPSGALVPSKYDIKVTDRMVKACELLSIPLIDHIIIGAGNEHAFFSFRDNNILEIDQVTYTEKIEDISWNKTVAEPVLEEHERM